MRAKCPIKLKMKFRSSKLILSAGLSGTLFLFGVVSLSTTKSIAARRAAAGQEQTIDPADVIVLGRKLFFDTTLSQPPGMACSSCHSPAAGFSYPNSTINNDLGPVPGTITGRFGKRKVPTAAYSTYLPTGVPTYDSVLGAYAGGLFFDGRVPDATAQAQQPFLNPNETNDTVHDIGSPALVVEKVKNGPSSDLFKAVYGEHIFSQPTPEIYRLIARSIAAFEASPEVAPFTSKYDAWLEGKATLTIDELEGLRMATGRANGRKNGLVNKYNAHCSECHGIVADPSIGPDLWTFSCYANLGVPKNPNNPFYRMTNRISNPAGYNHLGVDYIDYGLGDFLYPQLGKTPGDLAEGDPLAIDGTFKTPTLRNVDMRPYPGFVKCYMHNGVFKSLKQVVHFYNTRNLTSYPGEVIDFTKPDPYAGLKGKPLWPRPEWPSPTTMINPQGASNVVEHVGQIGSNEQIGNMGMTDQQEDQIVAFLKTLTDGYFDR